MNCLALFQDTIWKIDTIEPTGIISVVTSREHSTSGLNTRWAPTRL